MQIITILFVDIEMRHSFTPIKEAPRIHFTCVWIVVRPNKYLFKVFISFMFHIPFIIDIYSYLEFVLSIFCELSEFSPILRMQLKQIQKR